MTPVEQQYRSVVNRIAASLLLFLGLSQIMGVILTFLPVFLNNMSMRTADIVYELIHGLLYAAVFVLPVFFFRLISRGKEQQPLELALELPRETPLYLFVGVAVICAAVYINSLIVGLFDYASFTDEVIWNQSVTFHYQLVLQVFVMAVVPAFVEELLFRGLVLKNLLPYGRTAAIVASALLFGAMHQNAGQFFYATAAGVVLGLIYTKTKSFWCCVLLHFCNNFFSALQMAIAERMPNHTGSLVLLIMDCTLLAAGLVSAVILMHRAHDPREAVRAQGVFERTVPPHPDFEECPIAPHRKLTLFCSVPMVLFLALCAVQMVLYILLAVFFY